MKKTIVLPVLLALGFAVCVIAQSEADYSGWMKDVAATKGKVKKAMDSKSNSDVAENATHWAGLFKQVGAFWAGRNVRTVRKAPSRSFTQVGLSLARCNVGPRSCTTKTAVFADEVLWFRPTHHSNGSIQNDWRVARGIGQA